MRLPLSEPSGGLVVFGIWEAVVTLFCTEMGGNTVSKARNGPENFRKQASKLDRWTGGQVLCVFCSKPWVLFCGRQWGSN